MESKNVEACATRNPQGGFLNYDFCIQIELEANEAQ